MATVIMPQPFLMVLCVLLAMALIIPFFRVYHGPTLFDRMMGLGVISSKTIVLVAFVGFLFRRPSMFIDIVLAYSLLNYIGTIAIARYLSRRGGKT